MNAWQLVGGKMRNPISCEGFNELLSFRKLDAVKHLWTSRYDANQLVNETAKKRNFTFSVDEMLI